MNNYYNGVEWGIRNTAKWLAENTSEHDLVIRRGEQLVTRMTNISIF